MEKNSVIFIAGHQGMVGSAILRRLQSAGYSRFVLRTRRELDLMDQAATEAFFASERPEYVFDAAAKVGGIIANNTYRAEFIYENLVIQNNLIHLSWKYGVKKLLFLGSSCIYPREAPQPLKEEYLLTGPLEPTNEPYAIAKIAGIKMCESYHRQYGCDFLSVMPTNLYGPNDNYDLEKSHVLPALIRRMHLGKCLETGDWQAIRKDLDQRPVEGINGAASEQEILRILEKYGIRPSTLSLWGTGNVFREFLHVDDMADACVFLMEKNGTETASSMPEARFLNIGTGRDLTIRDLAEKVKEIVGFRGSLAWDPSRPDGMYKKQLDVSRLNTLGWKEKIPLEEGITSVYHVYQG